MSRLLSSLGVVLAFSILLLVLIYWIGPSVTPYSPPQEMGIGSVTDKIAIMMDAADHSISMLTSISIGLFALVGLAIGFSGSDKLHISTMDWIVLSLFAGASVASFYFAYLTRAVAAYYANGMIFPFKGIDTLVAWQAVCVGIAAIFAVAAAASQLIRRASLP